MCTLFIKNKRKIQKRKEIIMPGVVKVILSLLVLLGIVFFVLRINKLNLVSQKEEITLFTALVVLFFVLLILLITF